LTFEYRFIKSNYGVLLVLICRPGRQPEVTERNVSNPYLQRTQMVPCCTQAH